MFRFASPIILVGIAVAGFFLFLNPLYKEVSALKVQAASYNEALNNSQSLEAERDKLTQKYNSIDRDNLIKLEKLLPDSVDNIRLILEIEKLALPYGMMLKDIEYDVKKLDDTEGGNNSVAKNTKTASSLQEDNKIYGSWDLGFSTQGNYFDFLNFIKDLEKNLRIVDVTSIKFSSKVGTGLATNQPTNTYKYSFRIKTYWLKN